MALSRHGRRAFGLSGNTMHLGEHPKAELT
jgi:hypothetical protein